MPTISGLAQEGIHQIHQKIHRTIGVAKRDNIIDVSLLEFCVREDLNKTAPRIMAVLDPSKINNYKLSRAIKQSFDAENNPEDEKQEARKLPFSKTLYIEREDFKEEANNKYFRLTLEKKCA